LVQKILFDPPVATIIEVIIAFAPVVAPGMLVACRAAVVGWVTAFGRAVWKCAAVFGSRGRVVRGGNEGRARVGGGEVRE
jgi:hypothetical protein